MSLIVTQVCFARRWRCLHLKYISIRDFCIRNSYKPRIILRVHRNEVCFGCTLLRHHTIARAASWLDFPTTVAASWVARASQPTDVLVVFINKHHDVEPQTRQSDIYKNNFANSPTQQTVASSQLITSRQLTVGNSAATNCSTPWELIYSGDKKNCLSSQPSCGV